MLTYFLTFQNLYPSMITHFTIIFLSTVKFQPNSIKVYRCYMIRYGIIPEVNYAKTSN